MERIIGNLDKAKLKLDEAFFYLDEIEELIQEDELDEAAGSKVSQATERLTSELSAARWPSCRASCSPSTSSRATATPPRDPRSRPPLSAGPDWGADDCRPS